MGLALVLAYHEIVTDECPYIYGTTESAFEEHLKLIKVQSARKNTSLITFDDGHISQFRYALPLLEKHDLKATFFVTAGWIEAEPNYMRKAELRELLSLGHSVQAHGWSHRMFTHCRPAELWDELHCAKQKLQDILGVGIDSVSIPHGRWNRRVLEACAHAGYLDVYTSDSHVRSVPRSGIRLVGRLMVTRRLSQGTLVSCLDGRNRSALGYLKRTSKDLLRAVIGDERYRTMWLSLGAKQDRLPDPAPVKRPLRILQLISSGGFYGAENMVVTLSKALLANECVSIVCAFKNSRNPHMEILDRAERDGLSTEAVPCSGRLDLKAIRHLRRLVYKHGIDVVHAHGFKAQFYAAVVAGTSQLALAATYHSKLPDRGWRLRCYHALNRALLFRFNKVIAVSEEIEKSLRERGAVSGEKLVAIGNGVDIETFSPRDARPAGQLEKRSETVIGLVGRLIAGKGHCYLLQGAKAILERFPNTHFLFVGSGPELDNLRALTRSLGFERHVSFRGFEADMPAAYKEIDIVVLPSVTEGLPMTLIEAMAARRPVIATKVGDIPKLVKNEETGLLVDPCNASALSDAILRLLSNPAEAAAIAVGGQQFVTEKFSAVLMARRYASAYRKCLGTRFAGSPSCPLPEP